MQFLMKLFKALNSAQTPWQVTLALTLGMIAGLTPLAGIQNVLIVLAAFVLNIHLGLFFVASALFAGVGYLFDPWFEQLGYALLNMESLREIWTAGYNSGLMRMTHFNNTLVMGSTAVALVLAVPLYFLLGWVIHHYRDALAGILEKYPRLGLFGILKAEQKRDPLLRWWGAGVFVGVTAIVIAIGILMVDPVVKWSLEAGGSSILQRDVRIGDVNVAFTKGSVHIERIEVAGEAKGVDALSVEQAMVDIDLNALLLNQTHIESIIVKGMGFQTPATLTKKEASSTKKDAQPAVAKASDGSMNLPMVTLPTPESLLSQAGLQTHRVYDETQRKIQDIVTRWEKISQEDLKTDTLKELQDDFAGLKRQSRSKNPKELLQLKNSIDAFRKKIHQEQQRLQSIKKAFHKDQKQIQTLYKTLETASLEDYRHLKSTYELGSSGTMNLVGMIFGEQVKGYVGTATKYYQMLEPYLQSEPEPPIPPRGTGRWMTYPLTTAHPDLWIAKTEIDGLLQGQTFHAQVQDITDNQKHLGKATRFLVSSKGPQITTLNISGEDNRLGQEVIDRVTFEGSGVALEALDLNALTLGTSTLDFHGEVHLEDAIKLTGATALNFQDTSLNLLGEDQASKLIGEVLKGIHQFNADVTLSGSLIQPEVGVTTTLDKQLASAMKQQLSSQAKAYQKKLKDMMDAQVSEQLSALQGDAGKMIDIDHLVSGQTQQLKGLGGNAGDLLKKGVKLPIKGLPF